MDKKTEALKLALEALELEDMACRYEKDPTPEHIAKAITAIREALAEQPAQQEPVAYLTEDGDRVVTAKTYNSAKKDGGAMWSTMRPFCVPSYTSPPASKPWVGLTDEDILCTLRPTVWAHVEGHHREQMLADARAIEAKLRERNEHWEKNT